VTILLATDAFPPNCGGSGWSTYELARGLRARGHTVVVVQPRPGQRHAAGREYDGFHVEEVAAPAPPVPYVRNYLKNERLWSRLTNVLSDRIEHHAVDVVHAQHVLTTVPAIRAARSRNIPVVATVRDYWPVCYWSTIIIDPAQDALCPVCTVRNMTACIRPRAGAAWPAALPLIPYMRRNLSTKRTTLAEADAVIAVSSAIARDLAVRAPELRHTRIEQIPNAVDVEAIRIAASGARPLEQPYVLFSGKLEANKGADLLVEVARASGLRLPLVVVGDGQLRSRIEHDARVAGLDMRVTGWLRREDALRWIAHASVLVFPSRGPESLSRVLLEAAALQVPIAAMDTGGTSDIVTHRETGLLSTTAGALADDLGALLKDPALASGLGTAARAHVERTFNQSAVVDRIEHLYTELLERRGGRANRG
jgi:glycosyltransferase involved in cell wall biosynthesis